MNSAIESGVSSLLREFGSSVLQPLKEKIGRVVERALDDAMPRAVHPNSIAELGRDLRDAGSHGFA